MKTLSFVIPVHNVSEQLPNLMYGLRGLMLPKGIRLLEVIFVNDGSTDDTLMLLKRAKTTVLRQFKKKYPKAKIQIITYRNKQGEGFATQQGMLASSADYTLSFTAATTDVLTHISECFSGKQNPDITFISHKTIANTYAFARKIGTSSLQTLQHSLLTVKIDPWNPIAILCSKKTKDSLWTATHVRGQGYVTELLYLAKKRRITLKTKSYQTKTPVLFSQLPGLILDIFLIKWYYEWENEAKRLQTTLPFAQQLSTKLFQVA